MRWTSRALRLLPGLLTVWCLGCDAFESIAESLAGSRERARVDAVSEASSWRDEGGAPAVGSADAGVEAADACDCALGHAVALSVATTADQLRPTPVDFVDRPPAAVLPAPEPLLRPPVA